MTKYYVRIMRRDIEPIEAGENLMIRVVVTASSRIEALTEVIDGIEFNQLIKYTDYPMHGASGTVYDAVGFFYAEVININ